MTLDRVIYCQMWQSRQYTITFKDLKNLLESDFIILIRIRLYNTKDESDEKFRGTFTKLRQRKKLVPHMSPDSDFVTIRGRKYHVKNCTLDLNTIGIKDITEIEGLENLTNLKELNLQYNQIREIKGLESLINLQKLNLMDNKIEDLKGLENLNNLQGLYLCHNRIEELKGLEKLTNLHHLGLSENQIEDIKGLENLNELRELSFWSNRIKEINGLENLTKLKGLNLHYNPIKADEEHLVGKNAQEIVKYCQKKVEKGVTLFFTV